MVRVHPATVTVFPTKERPLSSIRNGQEKRETAQENITDEYSSSVPESLGLVLDLAHLRMHSRKM